MAFTPYDGVSIPALTDALTLSLANTALGAGPIVINLSGVDYKLTLASAISSQTKTIGDLASATSLSTADQIALRSAATGATVNCTIAQLQTLLGTGNGSSSGAPSQVGTLASGTLTATTIAVTYTAVTGTAPISYTGQTSPHGANTWTSNSGTFTSTGGTFVGLTSSTNYDLRIIATNSVGNSISLLSGVSTSAASGTAPGNVTSLAAGTPTSTTVPLSWVAPSTGTTPITYTVNYSAHGTSTWSAAAGTFSATGGTVTSLSPSTSYDFQVIATNSAGVSITSLTTGISTSAGSIYPSMTFTKTPAFVGSSAAKFGSGALSAGTGSVTVTPPPNGNAANAASIWMGFWFKSATGTFNGVNSDFVSLVNNGGTIGWSFGFANGLSVDNGGLHDSSVNIRDGAWHYLMVTLAGNYGTRYPSFFVDGAVVWNQSGGNAFTSSDTVISINFDNMMAGDLIDDLIVKGVQASTAVVPTSAGVRDSDTLVYLPFDGSGSGS